MVARRVVVAVVVVLGVVVPPAGAVSRPGAAGAASPVAAAPAVVVPAATRVPARRLVVRVKRLPKKTRTRVVVTGPSGYRLVKRTRTGFTLTGLRRGAYTIRSRAVTTRRGQYEARSQLAVLTRTEGARAVLRFKRTVVVTKQTEVLTRTEAQRLLKVRANVLRFEGPASPASVGEVVVSGPTTRAPRGLLRRVVAVTRTGGDTVLRTEPAKLTDVLARASVDLTAIPLDPTGSTVVSATSTPTVTASWYGQGRVGAQVGLARTWQASASGITVSADVGVQTGQSVDITLGIQQRLLTPVLTEYSTRVTMAQEIKATIGASAGGAAKVAIQLPKVRLGQVTVMVGPIPVVFTFRLDPELRAGVGFSRKATATLSGKVTRIAEVYYRNSSWGGTTTSRWETAGNVTTGTWSGYARGGLQADIAVAIYDLAGPIIGIEAGLRANATPDTPDLSRGHWELLGQGRADIGGKVNLLGLKDLALTIPLAQKDWTIKTGTWGSSDLHSWSFQDAASDVARQTNEIWTIDPSRANGDFTGLSVDANATRVRVVLTFREITPASTDGGDDFNILVALARTQDAGVYVNIDSGAQEARSGFVGRISNGRSDYACFKEAADITVNRTTKQIVVIVPARCLDGMNRFRVFAATRWQGSDGDFADDALRTGMPTGTYATSPLIYR